MMDTNKIVEKYVSECSIHVLKQEAQTNIGIAMLNDYTDDYNENYVAYIGDIVSGGYGQYQSKYVLEHFGIELLKDDYYDEYVWEVIDDIAYRIGEKLTELAQLEGSFYYGHLEADGSYGLFYTQEKAGDE